MRFEGESLEYISSCMIEGMVFYAGLISGDYILASSIPSLEGDRKRTMVELRFSLNRIQTRCDSLAASRNRGVYVIYSFNVSEELMQLEFDSLNLFEAEYTDFECRSVEMICDENVDDGFIWYNCVDGRVVDFLNPFGIDIESLC